MSWEESELDESSVLINKIEVCWDLKFCTYFLAFHELSEVSEWRWVMTESCLHEIWISLVAWVISDILNCLRLVPLDSLWGIFDVSKSKVIIWWIEIVVNLKWLVIGTLDRLLIVVLKFHSLWLSNTVQISIDFKNWKIALGLNEPMALILINIEILACARWRFELVVLINLVEIYTDKGSFRFTVVDKMSLLTTDTSFGWASSNSNIFVLEIRGHWSILGCSIWSKVKDLTLFSSLSFTIVAIVGTISQFATA